MKPPAVTNDVPFCGEPDFCITETHAPTLIIQEAFRCEVVTGPEIVLQPRVIELVESDHVIAPMPGIIHANIVFIIPFVRNTDAQNVNFPTGGF